MAGLARIDQLGTRARKCAISATIGDLARLLCHNVSKVRTEDTVHVGCARTSAFDGVAGAARQSDLEVAGCTEIFAEYVSILVEREQLTVLPHAVLPGRALRSQAANFTRRRIESTYVPPNHATMVLMLGGVVDGASTQQRCRRR